MEGLTIMKTNFKKVCTLFLTGTVLSSSLLFGQVSATDNEGKNLEQLIMEWEEAGIDSNHFETIEKIRNYITKNVDDATFASLHIDRDDQPLGIIVLSFTKEISLDMKKEIEALVEEPAMVSFRVVEYTEDQLMEKQREIDLAIFEKDVLKNEGITVYHTRTDIINNKVEIGISPFNDTTAQSVYDKFETDMISVVEGHEVQLLTGELKSDIQEADHSVVPISIEDEGQHKGFLSKILEWIMQLFK